jgi:hypothetical protein
MIKVIPSNCFLVKIMWLILLLLITSYNNVFGYECKTNDDCVGVVPNSMCVTNKCVYKFRYRRQINFGKRR